MTRSQEAKLLSVAIVCILCLACRIMLDLEVEHKALSWGQRLEWRQMTQRSGDDMDEFVALLIHSSKCVILGNIQPRHFSIYAHSIFFLYFVVVGKG